MKRTLAIFCFFYLLFLFNTNYAATTEYGNAPLDSTKLKVRFEMDTKHRQRLKTKHLDIVLTPQANADNLEIVVKNNSPNPVTIKMTNKNNKVVMVETLEHLVKFKKLYAFHRLPKGHYQLSISDEKEEIEKSIKITGKKLLHPDLGNALTVNFSELMPNKEMTLEVQNFSENPANIILYDNNGNLLLKTPLDSKAMTVHTLKLQPLRPGIYYLEVTNGETLYKMDIVI